MALQAAVAKVATMTRRSGTEQTGKLKSFVYLSCAAILFVLGLWLLLEPAGARGQSMRDNGCARNADALSA
ncbi:MAG: hypothetical protein WBQ95_01735 [Terracidiphilus sp.]